MSAGSEGAPCVPVSITDGVGIMYTRLKYEGLNLFTLC